MNLKEIESDIKMIELLLNQKDMIKIIQKI